MSEAQATNMAAKQLRILFAHQIDVFNSVAWSLDSRMIAAGSHDSNIRLWDIESGQLVRTLEGHQLWVQSVAWSGDGRWLASGAGDQTVRVWEASSGRLVNTLEGHQGRVQSVAWSGDGQWLASGADDQTVRVWEASSGRLVRTLEGHQGTVASVAWSGDGQWLASGGDDQTVRVWEANSGRLVRTLRHQGMVASVAWSGDGQWLASGANNQPVHVWEASSGRLVRTLEGHPGSVTSVAWSGDGRWLASGADDQTVRVWEASSGRLVRTLRHQAPVTSVAWSGDGRWLASGEGSWLGGGEGDQTVRVWEASSGRLVRTLEGHQDRVWSVAWSGDGQWLASGAAEQTVRVWEASSGRLVRTLEGHQGRVQSVAWSGDGRWLASGGDDQTVRVWEASSGRLVNTLRHQGGVQSVAWSGDGRWLASGGDDQTVRVWEASSGRLVRTLERHQLWVQSVAWSGDGRWLASGAGDQTVRVWEASSGRLVNTLRHQGRVQSVAWSGDGQWLASGADDQTVRVWEASSGRLVRTLEGHQGRVQSVAWSGDGQWLASGADDQTVRVWDVGSGTELAVYRYSYSAYNLLGISFVPETPVTAVFGKTRLGDNDVLVETPGLESHTPTSTPSPTSYVSAKIVLVGESNVGKSCLALRLAQDRYEEQGTTHGMRLWTMPPEQLSSAMAAPPGEKREVVIWDLGGQDEYRLVHQLFLHDTTLALILLDPTRGSRAFEDVREWNLRLEKQLRGRAAIKLLIGTKLDTDQALIDTVGLEQLVKECTCHDYFPTSAKVPHGIDTLRAAIAHIIDWNELSKTTRPRLFQRIREVINERQQWGEVVLLYSELERQIHEAEPNEFDPGAVNTVVEQLRGQGVLAESRLTTGQRVLVLQLGYVEQYAGALIIAARNAPRGIPVLEELAIARGTVPLPGIKPDERLNAIQERIVLDCVVQLLVDHGIALRQAGQLIFPALFPLTTAADDTNIAQTVSLYYDFSGAIDNLYSSLVVSLALSERFGRARLWKDRAQYEQPGTGVCGLHKMDRRSGLAHLDLFFSEETTDETRQLFTVFVEEHLRNEGFEIKEVLGMVCGACNYSFSEADVKSRIDQGHADIGCPRCDARWRISGGARQARASNPSIESELVALKPQIEERKREDIHDIQAAFKPIKLFLSYAHSDETLRQELIKHLSLLQRQGVIQTWHDRNINAGDDWKQQIDDNLNTATVILLLISADFLASDYCYDIEMQRALERHTAGEARVIPVILRPVDWQGAPFGTLQALPTDTKPITLWPNRDEACANVAQGVRRAVEAILRPTLPVETAAGTVASQSAMAPPVQAAPMRILHLSDLHFDKDDDPLARLQPLLRDIRDRDGGLGFEHLDYLILSGDLTNHGSAEEFDGVYRFVSELIKRFELSAGRCVIVPGNHDLSWEMEVYDWQPKRRVVLNTLKPGSYVAQGDGYLIRDDSAYLRRFENFGRFYHELIQLPYPLQPAAQCVPILFDDTRLQFLALNSAWEIDEYHRERASINQSALAAGLLEADEQIARARRDRRMAQDADVLRIAVWHHPVTGNEKISDDAFLEQLRQEQVKLCLHGHVHEDRADVIGYLHPRRAVYMAGAGSFGAPVNARPESTPRLYNLLEVWRDHSKIRVHTRCLRKDGGAWEGWAVWPGAQATERRTYYDIQLKG